MKDKIDDIIKIAKKYASDIEDYTDIIEDLRVEGFEDEHFKLYEIIRDLLNKKLEKEIREVFTDSVQILQILYRSVQMWGLWCDWTSLYML